MLFLIFHFRFGLHFILHFIAPCKHQVSLVLTLQSLLIPQLLLILCVTFLLLWLLFKVFLHVRVSFIHNNQIFFTLILFLLLLCILPLGMVFLEYFLEQVWIKLLMLSKSLQMHYQLIMKQVLIQLELIRLEQIQLVLNQIFLLVCVLL